MSTMVKSVLESQMVSVLSKLASINSTVNDHTISISGTFYFILHLLSKVYFESNYFFKILDLNQTIIHNSDGINKSINNFYNDNLF